MFKGNKEAAFSNYRLFEAMGFGISLGTSTLFCLRTKAAILLTVLVLGGIGYSICEYLHIKKEKRLAEMEKISLEDQRRAQLMRMQSQSFDPLEEVVDVVEEDNDELLQSPFRKSVAFIVGTDMLRDSVKSSRRVTRQENNNNSA